MIDYDSRDAKEYIDNYRKKIKNKFKENQKAKGELMIALGEEELTLEKRKEINEEYRLNMKSFVKELKSDENFAVYQKKYSEDMNEIRKLLGIYADYKHKWQPAAGKDANKKVSSPVQKDNFEALMITKLFPEAKEAAFKSSNEWDAFVEHLWKEMKKLNQSEKEKVFSSLVKMFSSPKNITKALNGIKHTDRYDTITYIIFTLFALAGIWLGIKMWDNEANYLLVKVLGASRFIHWVKYIGNTAKQVSIMGGKKDVNYILQPHRIH